MNILITADLHIDKHRRFDVFCSHNKRSKRLQDGLDGLKWIYEQALLNKCSDIIIAGDLFHTRHKVDVEVYNSVFKIIAESTGVSWHILAGNHDQYTDEITSIEALGYLPHVTAYSEPERIFIGAEIFDFIPYREIPAKYMEAIDSLEEPAQKPYCITHVSLDGAVVGTFEHRPKADMYLAYFPSYYKWIYAGHYHRHQTIKNFTYTGSLTPLDRSDIGQTKGVIILPDSGDHYFLPYTDPPHFVTVNWSDILSAKDLSFLSGNFVDLTVDVHPYPAMTEVQKRMGELGVRSFQSIYGRDTKEEKQVHEIIQTSRTSPAEAIRNYVVTNQKSKRFTAAGLVFLEQGKRAEK